jgi:hypothetical protein
MQTLKIDMLTICKLIFMEFPLMTVIEISHYDQEFHNLKGLLFFSISSIMEISDEDANVCSSEGLHYGHISI